MEKLYTDKDNCISEWGKENLKTIKKESLLKLINGYVMEIAGYGDELDDNQNLCESLNERNAKINLTCQLLKRQITNLKKVVELYEKKELDCRWKKEFVAPGHVQRSVGLQLRLHESHLESSIKSSPTCKIIYPSNSVFHSLTKSTFRSSYEANSSSSHLESSIKSSPTCKIIYPSNSVFHSLAKSTFRSSHEANSSSAYDECAIPPPFPEIVCDVATNMKLTPAQPYVKVKIGNKGKCVVVSWNVTLSQDAETLLCYYIYGYKEAQFLDEYKWKLFGKVKALPLPMAITLGQLERGFRYHFCVRAIDVQNRSSKFSDVKCIKFDMLDNS